MRSGFSAPLDQFLVADEQVVMAALSDHLIARNFSVDPSQHLAWKEQIAVLKGAAEILQQNSARLAEWHIVLEYEIPRRDKRIDALVLHGEMALVMEFKTGDSMPGREAIRQVEDYCLDLADFHAGSRHLTIVPIVVAPVVRQIVEAPYPSGYERVKTVVWTHPRALGLTLLTWGGQSRTDMRVDGEAWIRSPYQPVPGILEAASQLYASHSVADIVKSSASVENLSATAGVIVEAVEHAKERRVKIACFVTGVPGAGKTLAGLNAVHDEGLRRNLDAQCVFLSGNVPLLRVLVEALARNNDKRKGSGRTRSRRQVRTFVQSVHSFIAEHAPEAAHSPPERVIIFDEAQRAWNAQKMARPRRGGSRANHPLPAGSEPELLIGSLDRHHDWAVFVGLIGGGQEINDGEAGIEEWGRVLEECFPDWEVWVAPQALSASAGVGLRGLLEGGIQRTRVVEKPSLHLGVSVRSFRSESHSSWVDAVLAGDQASASLYAGRMGDSAPRMCRDLHVLRRVLRESCRGTRRSGLVASSGAIRLRAEGIEVSSGFTNQPKLYPDWFLSELDDVRASNALEVAATEFNCQGLELDWVGLCWGDDFTWDSQAGDWRLRRFKGGSWQSVRKPIDREYAVNKYRVLLTRAREGLVLWVPRGDVNDPTRNPSYLDQTANYLLATGVRAIV